MKDEGTVRITTKKVTLSTAAPLTSTEEPLWEDFEWARFIRLSSHSPGHLQKLKGTFIPRAGRMIKFHFPRQFKHLPLIQSAALTTKGEKGVFFFYFWAKIGMTMAQIHGCCLTQKSTFPSGIGFWSVSVIEQKKVTNQGISQDTGGNTGELGFKNWGEQLSPVSQMLTGDLLGCPLLWKLVV